MNSMKQNELTTIELINQVVFRHFLEKGYEATNLRRISDEVGIKAASIYFYYKSKSELFFTILNGIFEKQMKLNEETIQLNSKLDPEEQLYMILINNVHDCIKNSVNYKFRLRYKMFPSEEIATEIRIAYEQWQEREYELYKPVFEQYLKSKNQEETRTTQLFYMNYRRFLYGIIYEILISGLSIRDDVVYYQWKQFLLSTL